VNLIFHKASQGTVEGGQIWRSWRPGSEPPLANPSFRQLPIQECCHLIVDVWWHSSHRGWKHKGHPRDKRFLCAELR